MKIIKRKSKFSLKKKTTKHHCSHTTQNFSASYTNRAIPLTQTIQHNFKVFKTIIIIYINIFCIVNTNEKTHRRSMVVRVCGVGGACMCIGKRRFVKKSIDMKK